MRRGTSNATGFVIGLLLGLVLFLVAAPMFGNVFKKGGESIDALQSCDQGLIGSLAGEGGRGVCYNNADAEEFRKFIEVSSDMNVQYIGKGWGCPADEKKKDDLEKYAPYCWLVYYKDQDARTVGEIAKQKCDSSAAGSIGIMKTVQGTDTCLLPEAEASAISPNEPVRIRYFPVKEGTSCIFTYTLAMGQTRIVESTTGPCEKIAAFGTGSTAATPYELLGTNDKSLLNDGGTFKITVTEDGASHESTFSIQKPSPQLCHATTGDTRCGGRAVGQLLGADPVTLKEVHCTPDAAWACTPR